MSLSARGATLAGGQGDGLPSTHTYDRETNPEGLIAPAYAINEIVSPDLAAFASTLPRKAEHFLYAWPKNGGPGLRPALAAHLNETFRPHTPISAEHIVIGAGATSIAEILAFALLNPGDGLLLSRPIYPGYLKDFVPRAGGEVCFADTSVEESLDPDKSVAAFDKALIKARGEGTVVKAVLIANPNNPLGRCYSVDTIIAIMAFCAKHNLHFISDEIFGATEFSAHLRPSSSTTTSTPSARPTTFTSILSIPPSSTTLPESQRHVIYGLAKDFGAAGLRVGALISQSNPSLLSSARTMLRFHEVSGPSVGIATAMLEDREWCREYLRKTREGLARGYEYLTRGLREVGVEFVEGGCAGFFVFVDLSPFLPEVDGREKEEDHGEGPSTAELALAKKLVDNGLYLCPRAESYGQPGWFRFVFSHEEHVIDEALRRLKRAILS